MQFTIPELARAVRKSEGFIRQHIHRKHLAVHREGRNMTVVLDEAMRWAHERGLSFVSPTGAQMTTATTEGRTARMAVLSSHEPGARPRNLFTHLRHRRQEALGPWEGKPAEAWQTDDLGHDLRLSTFEAPLERCQALVDRVLGSGTLEIEGSVIDYAVEPHPRRHWAFRDRRPRAEASVRSPFSRHSAEVTEYWSLAAEPRTRWMEVLASQGADFQTRLARLCFPLGHRVERVGNLMIARAEDAIACSLEAHRDNTLRFRIDGEEMAPESYRATVWASHSGDHVLRQEIPVALGQTVIDLATDVDHIGFSVCRAIDGQCIDMEEFFLIMAISGSVNLDVGPKLHIRDRGGRLIQTVQRPAMRSTIDVRSDKNSTEIDKGIRRLWLDRQLHEREAEARKERNFVRFEPDKFAQAVDHFIGLLQRESDTQGPIFLADPYFMNYLKARDGHKLYLRMFSAATADRPLHILCVDSEIARSAPWWTTYPKDLTRHVHVRSFLRRGDMGPGFHDRYLIAPERETVITHSFNGWFTDGVTFASHPHGVYRAEAQRLWDMEVGSTTTPLLVRKIT